MAVRLEERFSVAAPPGPTWDFLVDPRRVVACVPGGALERVVDARTFDGRVRVLVGPLALAYRGQVHLAEVDQENRRVVIVGRAHERGGSGRARLTLASRLAARPGGGTDVEVEARLEAAGRLVELGSGLLQALGHLVFQAFAAEVRAAIEGGPAPGAPRPPPPPLQALPLLLGALRAWLGAGAAARGTARPAR